MNRNIRLSAPWVPYFVRLADGLSILLAGIIALKIRLFLNVSVEFPADLSGYYALCTIAAILFSALPANVYRSWRGAELPAMLSGIAGRWMGIVGLILLWMFVFKASQEFSRIWLVTWVFTALILLWLERFMMYLFLRFMRRRGFNLRHIALIGDGPAAKNLEQRLEASGWSGYSIALLIRQVDDVSISQLQEAEVDEVWLALPLSEEGAIRRILHALRHGTASIRYVPDLFALQLVNHGVTDVLGIPMFDLSTSPMTGMNQLLKWCEDKLFSSFILLLISPLMLLLAIGVKLTSPGPVFYRQERIGLNNKPFDMLKFRSMPVDTESNGVEWGGSAAKATHPFGQFIRKTSLDELPQFLNVLKGDMSIVGPRPERPMFVEQFKEEIPDYMKKHLVKAGITGWAQVHGWRGDTDLKTRIEYDIFYIENWTLWLDIKIIVMTIFKGFVNKNAY
ncbi:undecaprenyl-phosphate glucose phosphotransferase [Polynucleobacter asymbioticus]|jgi:putative colanic acid biosynthesis UDP-glucose lipid carrier transferase|uniref:undecaprenyl-phosphate glucose phosphotransferase n=1 Tax=Polynucleobacter asymbioticus TaxID=576611 RepID=UPI0008F7F5E0|nr:undecaprenyl-phosphate glucose phosphotransferase [Polynucleobacter asymbioticus]